MHAIFFTDKLRRTYRCQLQNMFYFNAYQNKYFHEIEKLNLEIGIPYLDETKNRIDLKFRNIKNDIKIYVLDEDSEDATLLAVLAYNIVNNICDIFHIAVNEHCIVSGLLKNELITFRLIENLRQNLLKRHNIEFMKIPYRKTLLKVNQRIIKLF